MFKKIKHDKEAKHDKEVKHDKEAINEINSKMQNIVNIKTEYYQKFKNEINDLSKLIPKIKKESNMNNQKNINNVNDQLNNTFSLCSGTSSFEDYSEHIKKSLEEFSGTSIDTEDLYKMQKTIFASTGSEGCVTQIRKVINFGPPIESIGEYENSNPSIMSQSVSTNSTNGSTVGNKNNENEIENDIENDNENRSGENQFEEFNIEI